MRLRGRDVILPALLVNAASITLAHNHPSGNPAPSPSDRNVTARLRAATNLVGVAMFDHVMVTDRRGYSFRATRRWRDSAPEAPDDSVLHGLASFTGGGARPASAQRVTGKGVSAAWPGFAWRASSDVAPEGRAEVRRALAASARTRRGDPRER